MSNADDIRGQYRDSSKLARRANLHKYASSPGVSWFDWIAQKASLPDSTRTYSLAWQARPCRRPCRNTRKRMATIAASSP